MTEYIFIDARGKEEVGRGDGVTRDIYSSFWIDVSVSSSVRKKEDHLFAMICTRRNGKQSEKY